MKRIVHCLLVIVYCLVFVGCQREQGAVKEQTTRAITEEMVLKSRAESLQKENEQLKLQVETLSKLPGDKRAEAIYRLERIRIGSYTNFYDENKDGKFEQLIVFIEPVDEIGDIIKAAGTVEVQLWNLNKPGSEAMVGKWDTNQNELKKLWSDSLLVTGYRLPFDTNAIDIKPAGKSEFTVKVTFTDYVSGKVFVEQKAIKP